MSRPCSICTHPDREAIDQALVIDRLSLRDVARRFGATKDSLSRHRPHISAALTKAQEASEAARADTLLDRVKGLCDRSERLLASGEEVLGEARQAKDGRLALDAIRTVATVARELRGNLTLLGEMTGELREGQQGPMVQAVIIMPGPRLEPGGRPANLEVPERPVLPAPQDGEVIDTECVEEAGEDSGEKNAA